MDLQKFYREDHTFYKVIVGDFNAKIDLRRTPEELHIEKATKYKKRSLKPTIDSDLFTTLASFWEDTVVDNIDEEYERLIQHLRDSAKKAESSRTTKRRLSLTKMTALRRPDGTTSSSRRVVEKVIYDFNSELFDSHVHLPPCHLREDGYVIPSVLPSEVRHAIKSAKNLQRPVPTGFDPNI
ncbi:hypothetical protein Y032_0010g847 [Ancylostoma ceylanicum]|uniref:Uncharacterized protein n=1 Tax=Ancylostoma ceylanicum TaxID=53326 RepID=A0A016VIL9_9BILA|nr:hypothetical protein Y032_0010g847 [Ancylostoma ceylanicum]